MPVTLILPQLVFQYLGEGKAFGGKNWQGWRGAFKQYQVKINDRYTKDQRVIDRLKLATTKEEQENIMLGASDEMRRYANSVGMSIEKMEKFNKQAKASAHPIQALKAGIKGLGKELALAGIQFAAFWAASKLIEAGINWIDSQVNALKYAKEAAENLNKAYEGMNTTQKQNTKTVEEYGKTWEKLKDGVNEEGKNVSLSDDEYEQYKESINQIISILPGIASGWDENNNAILMNVQSMDELNQKMEEYAQKQRETLLAGDETSLMRIWKGHPHIWCVWLSLLLERCLAGTKIHGMPQIFRARQDIGYRCAIPRIGPRHVCTRSLHVGFMNDIIGSRTKHFFFC